MSIEAKMDALAAALAANTAILERVVAGQNAALEKMETPKATRTTRKAADPEPAAEGKSENAHAATESQEAAAKTVTEPAKPAVTDDELKSTAGNWLNAAEAKEERTKRGEFLMALTKHFGSPKLTGPDATLTVEQIEQAIWFIKRQAAGIAVDLNADHDFDSDPAAPVAEDFDPLG